MIEHMFTFTEAVAGYELHAQSRQLSDHTIADYMNTYTKFYKFLAADPPLAAISRKTIEQFLAAQTTISKKTLLNYHTGLSALFTWAIGEGIVSENPLQSIERPNPKKKPVIPYTEDEVRSMLKSLEYSRPYVRPGKREAVHSLPNAARNRAIILLLLDTGIRAEELCTLTIKHLDTRNRRIRVEGKGRKERIIPYSTNTGQALWRYIHGSRPQSHSDCLFLAENGNPLTRSALLLLIYSIARRAGVKHANVHRFRHTFAINYLRNSGDPWSLQMLLGHSTMDMVKTYLQIAQVDLDSAHRRASPVSNWRL